MFFDMFTFKSDYLEEKTLSLEHCMLVASTLPKAFPTVFFTRNISCDRECEIMVVEVFKKENFDCRIRNKNAKTVIITTTPLASLDFFISSGMQCSCVLMEQEKIIEAAGDLKLQDKQEDLDSSGRKCSLATKNSLLNHTSHQYNRLLNPNDIVVSTIYTKEERSQNSEQPKIWGHFQEYSASYFQESLNEFSNNFSPAYTDLDLVKKRVMNMRKRQNEKKVISPYVLATMRENFLISSFDQENSENPAIVASPPVIQNYGKLQRRYNLKKALKKILDQRRLSNKFKRMQRVNNSSILPCSFNFNRCSGRILRRSNSEMQEDSICLDSTDSCLSSFVVETTENNYGIFNTEDGMINVRSVVSNIRRQSARAKKLVLRKNLKRKDIQRLFALEETESMNSDCESI